ncbi:BA14K family protein [Sphingobium yanoikuyae]|uniref:BA14K family protein n=1 Tax=Sphingobium yanoikuyae TaxID=13690 RepID=UPI00289E2A04|nr:BA14K family protein [Sphingobium yanoikuyae]
MKMMIFAAAVTMALSGTAMAQPRHDAPRQNAQKPAPKPVASKSRYTPPKHWNQPRDHYDRHVQACQKRYRTYNPHTDRYTISRGRTAICRL